jgi:REP-associated tyrosine transposase
MLLNKKGDPPALLGRHQQSDSNGSLIATPKREPRSTKLGKSAIHIDRTYLDQKRNYVGQHFWARGYFASKVSRDEQVIREYIRHQEAEDRRIDKLPLTQ